MSNRNLSTHSQRLGIFIPKKELENDIFILRNIRDKISCNEKEKNMIFATGFLSPLKLESTEHTAITLEIVGSLTNTKNNEILIEIKKLIPEIIEHVKTLPMPYTIYHVSIYRSIRLILFRAADILMYSKYLQFISSILETPMQDCYTIGIKNELLEFLRLRFDECEEIRKILTSKKIIKLLLECQLNSIKILDKIISEKTKKHIKITKLFKKLEGCNIKNRLIGLLGCIKLYKILNSKDLSIMEKLIVETNNLLFVDRLSFVLIGKMCEDNLPAQQFCRKIGIVDRLLENYKQINDNTISEELLYCLYALATNSEDNRKAIAKSIIIPSVFSMFKKAVSENNVDLYFILLLKFFKVMTRSVSFLRCDLLDYPLIEILLPILDEKNSNVMIDKNINLLNEKEIKDINEIILEILVNLVLDYGNYKSKFMVCGGVDKVMEFRMIYPHTTLKIFKNFLYDSNINFKNTFIKSTNKNFFKDFFSLYSTSKDFCILEGCFNVLRNLICDEVLECIFGSYIDLLEPIFYYLNTFSNTGVILENSKEEAVLLQIFYTIVNLGAGAEKFKNVILEKANIKNLIDLAQTPNLRIALVWIFINLSWKEDGYEKRIEILKAYGVKEWLIEIQAKDPRLSDKVITALDNLR